MSGQIIGAQSKGKSMRNQDKGQLIDIYLQNDEPIEATIKRIEQDFFMTGKKEKSNRVETKQLR